LRTTVSLLPTPAVNDMGAGKTVEHWDEWTAAMQAKHGNGNGHGKSLAIETLRLLPTPTTQPSTGNGHARNLGKEAKLLPTPRSQNGETRNQNIWERPLDQPQNLENALARIGVSTPPPSTAGNTSSDDLRLPLPSQDPKADND